MNSKEGQILDKITAEIRNEKVDPAAVSAAADRVWARVSAAAGRLNFSCRQSTGLKAVQTFSH
jgi:hypothetical protein